MKAVIFDIDGTLADASHRLHFVTGGNRDWSAFFGAMGDDPPVWPICDLLTHFIGKSAIVLCSGRPENYRGATEDWLRRTAGIVRYDALYMRPEGDHRPDHVVKAQLLAGMREDGYEPWLAIDDRPSIVAMWRENGITCLQCRDWDDRHDPAKIAHGLLTIMVGPSGAGKTTWLQGGVIGALTADSPMRHRTTAHSLGLHSSHIVSSDQIRADLCGDFRSQDRNAEVFAALHAVVKTRLAHGLPTIVDAPNLRNKDRLAIVDLSPMSQVRYIVIDRSMEEKRRDAGWRAEIKGGDGEPFDLIAKHAQTFASNLREILAADGRPYVTVVDLR